MKKYVSTLLIATLISLIGFSSQTNASMHLPLISQVNYESLNDEYYFETTIEENESTIFKVYSAQSNVKYITRTKTTYMKSSDGSVLWSVSIKATFSYNGKTSNCISYSHSTTCPDKGWTIKSCTSKKDKNSATAKAVAVRKALINESKNVTKSVTIKCSPTGKVS